MINSELESTGIKVSVPIQEKEDTVIKVGEVFTTVVNGIRAFFLHNDEYYDREFLYGTPKGGYADNCPRFVFYSRGAVEFIRAGGYSPQVIHCHDWQSCLISLYIKTLYKDDPAIGKIKTLLTIHNLAYQGVFWKYDLKQIGLDESFFTPECMEYLWQHQFPQRRHPLLGHHQHREQEVREAKSRPRSSAANSKACCSRAPMTSTGS